MRCNDSTEDAESMYYGLKDKVDKIVLQRMNTLKVPTDKKCLTTDKDISQVTYHFNDKTKQV